MTPCYPSMYKEAHIATPRRSDDKSEGLSLAWILLCLCC